MSHPTNPDKGERPSTYVVQDRKSEEELRRLITQDRLVTTSMGGVLPEQEHLDHIHRVLDVGCGPGGWLLELARFSPTMQLCGIDISLRMVEYARTQAKVQQVADQVEFHSMDALLMLAFPTHFYDMVNLRFAVSFLRTWDWPKMLGELQRVTYPGGIIRITDGRVGCQSNSEALNRLSEQLQHAFFRAGHLFEDTPTGLIDTLAPLLVRYGCQHVQTKEYTVVYRAGTEAGNFFADDMEHLFHTIRPFISKWGYLSHDYDTLYQQMLHDIRDPSFEATATLLTAWGQRSPTATTTGQMRR